MIILDNVEITPFTFPPGSAIQGCGLEMSNDTPNQNSERIEFVIPMVVEYKKNDKKEYEEDVSEYDIYKRLKKLSPLPIVYRRGESYAIEGGRYVANPSFDGDFGTYILVAEKDGSDIVLSNGKKLKFKDGNSVSIVLAVMALKGDMPTVQVLNEVLLKFDLSYDGSTLTLYNLTVLS